MKRPSPVFLLKLCLAALSGSAFADVVTLTSGEKVSGKITAETDTAITIDARVSAGISDERILKKSDVVSVEKDAPDDLAWQPLKNLKPGRNSLPMASYEAVLASLSSFATDFPQSRFAAEAQKLAVPFAEEKKRVEAGEVKLENKWLGKEEVQKERYQINATIAFNYLKEQGARDLIGALNTFEAIEKNYPGSRSYPDAVEYAQRLVTSLRTETSRRKAALAAQKAQREATLKTAAPAQKAELLELMKRERDATDLAVTAAERQQLRWTPLVATSERNLEILFDKTASETQRLAGLPVGKMRASMQAVDKARAALEAKDLEAAEATLQEATDAWSANEQLARLRADLDAAKATAKAAPVAAAEPAAAPEPSVPKMAPAAPEPAPAVVEETAEEPATPFFLTTTGAISVVVVVALLVGGLSLFKKLRRPGVSETEDLP